MEAMLAAAEPDSILVSDGAFPSLERRFELVAPPEWWMMVRCRHDGAERCRGQFPGR